VLNGLGTKAIGLVKGFLDVIFDGIMEGVLVIIMHF